jgi:hypothetical protein
MPSLNKKKNTQKNKLKFGILEKNAPMAGESGPNVEYNIVIPLSCNMQGVGLGQWLLIYVVYWKV